MTAAKTMCPNVKSTEKPCKYWKRFFWPVSVARLMAGISICRAAMAVNMVNAIHAALNASFDQDVSATKPDVTITNR